MRTVHNILFYETCDLCVKIIQPKQQHKPTLSFSWTWAFKCQISVLEFDFNHSIFVPTEEHIHNNISVFHYFKEISQPQSCSKAP